MMLFSSNDLHQCSVSGSWFMITVTNDCMDFNTLLRNLRLHTHTAFVNLVRQINRLSSFISVDDIGHGLQESLKNCQKLVIFSKNCNLQVFRKNDNLWAFFLKKKSRFWHFFDIQMAIFGRVKCKHK